MLIDVLTTNTEELEKEIGKMTPRWKLYKVLKRALSSIGRWRNQPRGDPAKGYRVQQERKGK